MCLKFVSRKPSTLAEETRVSNSRLCPGYCLKPRRSVPGEFGNPAWHRLSILVIARSEFLLQRRFLVPNHKKVNGDRETGRVNKNSAGTEQSRLPEYHKQHAHIHRVAYELM